jgi:Cu-processing system permease protein
MKSVYFLILCVLVLIQSTVNYDVLSMGSQEVLMINASYLLNSITVILVAISITFEISKELREGVASVLLTKPLGRTQYLIGKFVGIVGTGFVLSALITIGFALIYSSTFGKVSSQMLQAHLLIALSIIPLSAIAVLFAVILPEPLSALLTVVVIWLAHMTTSLSNIQVVYGGLLPDLHLFNLNAEATLGTNISWLYVLLIFLWAISYSVFTTTIASFVFARKDLN